MSNRKKIVQKETSNSKKKVFSENIDPNKYLSKKPTWKFNRCDLSSPKWSILDSESFSQDILSKLISYECMTWAEIQSSSGGKSHGTNSHFERICDMSKDVQNRAEYLHLNVDVLFSLRLTGATRLYGILDEGVFNIIWFDKHHEIYPSHKSHT